MIRRLQMRQEFLHGSSVNARYDEMSPLDRAIETYSSKAKKYYSDLNKAEKAPKDVRDTRKKELAAIKKHLENERRLMESIVDVQSELEAYRIYGKQAVHQPGQSRSAASQREAELLAEDHHPPELLEKYMRAVPIPKPSSTHTAHHIVPGKGKTKSAGRARMFIHALGIRINDPDNGVWLPTYAKHTPSWAMPNSLGHLQYHTEGYEWWVNNKLQKKSTESFVRLELQLIGMALQQNKLPPQARKKK